MSFPTSLRVLTSRLLPAGALALSFIGCQSQSTAETKTTATTTAVADAKTSPSAINAAELGAYLQAVSSDEMQGRKPFTVGEKRITAYLAAQFKQLGLQPGLGGSYFQSVPMVEISVTPAPTMQVAGKGQKLTLQYIPHAKRL